LELGATNDTAHASEGTFQFVTQLPRDDGCGVVVLQMLSGQPYEQLAGMIDWGRQTNHYMTWGQLFDVLVKLRLNIGESRVATSWADIDGVAVVHLQGDHYILCDADNAVFYDPGLAVGPDTESSLIPMSYFSVRPSVSGV
jgi:hypothetical protein